MSDHVEEAPKTDKPDDKPDISPLPATQADGGHVEPTHPDPTQVHIEPVHAESEHVATDKDASPLIVKGVPNPEADEPVKVTEADPCPDITWKVGDEAVLLYTHGPWPTGPHVKIEKQYQEGCDKWFCTAPPGEGTPFLVEGKNLGKPVEVTVKASEVDPNIAPLKG